MNKTKYFILQTIRLLFIAIIIAMFTGCKSEKKQDNKTEFETSMTVRDTLAVKELVDQFFDLVEQGQLADAAGMVYKTDPHEPYKAPVLLDNEDLQQVMGLLKSIPISSHRIDYIKFNESYANEVKCTAIIEPATDGNPEISTVFYFKPVDVMGNWLLCLIDSRNGDQTIIDRNARDSVEKRFSAESLEETL